MRDPIKETDKYHFSYETNLVKIKASDHVYKRQLTVYGIHFAPVDFEFPSFHISIQEAYESEDVYALLAEIDAEEIEMRKLFTLSEDGTRLDVHTSGNWYSIREFPKGYAFGINGSTVDELVVRATPNENEKGKATLYEYCVYLAEVLDPDIKTKMGGVVAK